MQRFINNPLAQYVSGISMPIFGTARPYVIAYGFQHYMCRLESWEAGKQAVCTHTDCAHIGKATYILSQLFFLRPTLKELTQVHLKVGYACE